MLRFMNRMVSSNLRACPMCKTRATRPRQEKREENYRRALVELPRRLLHQKLTEIGRDYANVFTLKERGRLITSEENIVNELAKRNYTDYNKQKCGEHQQVVDEKFLPVI